MLTLLKQTNYRVTPSGSKRMMGLYKCHCGVEKEISVYNVKSGKTISCGCESIKQIRALGKISGSKKPSYSHGMFGTRFYNIYFGIVSRCNGKNIINKKWYSEKGIKCEWNKFEDFRDDMYQSYLDHVKEFGEKQTTIDRINSDGNYCKDNCRWATYKEQARWAVGKTELVKNTKGHKRNHNKSKKLNA